MYLPKLVERYNFGFFSAHLVQLLLLHKKNMAHDQAANQLNRHHRGLDK